MLRPELKGEKNLTELDLTVGSNYLIRFHYCKIPYVNYLWEQCHVKNRSCFCRSRFVFAAAAAAPPKVQLSPPAPNSTKLAGGFSFTEGPAADADGNIYFTDQPNDRIMKWTTAASSSTFMKPCGRSNGLCFDADGKLWACADEKNEMWKIDVATKTKTVVIKDYRRQAARMGRTMSGCGPTAGFTSPIPIRSGPTGSAGRRRSRSRASTTWPQTASGCRVVDDLSQPNGIIGTPDGKTLYVADIRGDKTYAYDIRPDGSLKGKRLFCKLGSDGMTIDDVATST